MNIDTIMQQKWGIDSTAVYGSGSVKDIQLLCNELYRIRKIAILHLCTAKEYIKSVNADCDVDEDRDGLVIKLEQVINNLGYLSPNSVNNGPHEP